MGTVEGVVNVAIKLALKYCEIIYTFCYCDFLDNLSLIVCDLMDPITVHLIHPAYVNIMGFSLYYHFSYVL